MRILVTGYAGFIGSNLIRMLWHGRHGNDQILGLDAYTYAARPDWAFSAIPNNNDAFMATQVDLRSYGKVAAIVKHFNPDQVYHLAAESHVCKSIEGPRAFVESNIVGTFNLIEALREAGFRGRMVHVSTDEVFGQLRKSDDPFDEKTMLEPTSPYSSSKAASDLIVQAFCHTYDLNASITRCTNNYGPNQHREKLIPRTISRIEEGLGMVLHGDGSHSRDWIFVDDHCRALMTVMRKGKQGVVYCVGSGLELTNKRVVQIVSESMGVKPKYEFTNDRPTDDQRYAVNTDRIESLGWAVDPTLMHFKNRIGHTVKWYRENDR